MKQKALFLSAMVFAVLSVVLGTHGTIAAFNREPVERGWFVFVSVGIMLVLLFLYLREKHQDEEPAG